jgi:phosphopantetheinyl transferase
MFHGPAFQAIMEVERCATDGTVATMRKPLRERFFRSTAEPEFVAEPVLLDAAGQLIGLWTMETLERGFVVFPYRMEALEFFGPALRPGEVVTCRARCSLEEGGRVVSDIELIDQLGDLRIRLAGWEDKRFHIPRELYHFILSPGEHPLSKSWEVPLSGHPQPERYRCTRIGEWGVYASHSEFWLTVLAHLILNPQERKLWEARTGPERRRRDWLLGRVAAKEAIISLLRDHYALDLAPADIAIATDDDGRPYVEPVQDHWQLPAGATVNISISHSENMVVALAGLDLAPASLPSARLGVGIDIEPAESEAQSFADIAFTAEEQQLLSDLESYSSESWALRLWCAKEAFGKALGCGLSGGLHNLVATHIQRDNGLIFMNIRGTLAERFPTFAGSTTRVFTAQDSGWIVASVLDSYSLQR